ncbi:MAG: prolyl oligopeptidase family serine peptidase [Gemmatimonadaceae bacterium]|nr:prolyl oligopeptidase family serine peptidase [Gemmatimonadaceae bacterium]
MRPSHPMRACASAARVTFTTTLAATAILASLPSVQTLAAQQNGAWDPQAVIKAESYVKPPAVLERIVMAPRTDISFTEPNADRSWFLRTTGKERGTVAAYGAPHIYLGGLALDTRANRARSLTVSTRTGLTVVNPKTGATKVLQAPAGASISAEVWSPDGKQIAYIANFTEASHVYVADVASGRSTQITRTPLLATLYTDLRYTGDGKHLIAVLVPENRGPQPNDGGDGIDDGPKVRLTGGRALPQPVHWSLLEDPNDQALLKWYTTGQLALIDVAKKTVKKVGAPTMIRAVDAAHDGSYLRVTRMTEPFSYIVPVSSFGSVQELWDANGTVVHTLATTPLREGGRGAFGPGGAGATGAAADTGKRNLQWNPVGPGLVYFQSVFAAPAAGEGRPARQTPARATATSVRYMQWLPPFGPNDTKLIYEGGPQFTALSYSANSKTMFVNDSGTVSAVRVSEPTKKYALGRGVTLPGGGFGGFGGGGGGFGGGNQAPDTVGVGGALATTRGPNGQTFVVVGSDDKTVFVSGSRSYGADWHTKAPRPWVDRVDFETAARTRVIDSPADTYEQFVTALDADYREVIVTRQTATTIEDAWLRDTRSGSLTQLTKAVDVAPEVTGAVRKRVRVTRPRDGTQFWAEVVLPRTWKKGDGTPGVIWFYPREYATMQAYERSKFATNINLHPAVPAARPATATELWVAGGYVFIEPDIPIYGDSGRMNDNYTRDLKENLDAVVDAMVDSGFVARDKFGIGGHSYGAFSTVNAMTLVPYFKAGIAGDGMYNRSLTPFGFQSERRNFFEAQDTYLDMSPFFRADKISGALLLYHNLEDQNTGTAPMSSIRMMSALQGLGKEAALYLYPYEDHSVMTYESDLDQWARWIAWFDVHLKGAKPSFTP